MSKMKSMQTLIEEVARIALEDNETLSNIARELGVDQEELQHLGAYLNSLVEPSMPTK